MEKSLMRLFLSCLAASLLLLALAAIAQEAGNSADKNWVAPSDAAAKQNPQLGKPDSVAAGQKIFLRSCAECHGEDGTGLQEGVSNLQSPDVQKQSDGALFWKITTGNVKKGMPAFGKLEDNDRWNAVSYLRTLKSAGGSNGANQPTSPKAQ
jgi:mono/diheme cytochrome c family protein